MVKIVVFSQKTTLSPFWFEWVKGSGAKSPEASFLKASK